jgi:hypothetical protein
MKFLGALIFNCIAIGAFQYLHWPWYLEGLAPVLAALLFFPNWGGAFASGSLGFVIVWGIHISHLMEAPSDLPQRIADMTGLEDIRILIVLILGAAGLWGGIAGLVGWSFRAIFVSKRRRY